MNVLKPNIEKMENYCYLCNTIYIENDSIVSNNCNHYFCKSCIIEFYLKVFEIELISKLFFQIFKINNYNSKNTSSINILNNKDKFMINNNLKHMYLNNLFPFNSIYFKLNNYSLNNNFWNNTVNNSLNESNNFYKKQNSGFILLKENRTSFQNNLNRISNYNIKNVISVKNAKLLELNNMDNKKYNDKFYKKLLLNLKCPKLDCCTLLSLNKSQFIYNNIIVKLDSNRLCNLIIEKLNNKQVIQDNTDIILYLKEHLKQKSIYKLENISNFNLNKFSNIMVFFKNLKKNKRSKVENSHVVDKYSNKVIIKKHNYLKKYICTKCNILSLLRMYTYNYYLCINCYSRICYSCNLHYDRFHIRLKEKVHII